MKDRYILNFPPEQSRKPLTYQLIKDYDIKINILRAEITAGKEGRLLIEVEADKRNLQTGLDFLKKEHVSIYPLKQEVFLDEEKCINCGVCVSVCFSGALDIDRNEWKIKFDPEKCVACELCTKACPLGIINLYFGEDLQPQ